MGIFIVNNAICKKASNTQLLHFLTYFSNMTVLSIIIAKFCRRLKCTGFASLSYYLVIWVCFQSVMFNVIESPIIHCFKYFGIMWHVESICRHYNQNEKKRFKQTVFVSYSGSLVKCMWQVSNVKCQKRLKYNGFGLYFHY